MKIPRVRTLQAPEQPHVPWLQVHTAEALAPELPARRDLIVAES